MTNSLNSIISHDSQMNKGTLGFTWKLKNCMEDIVEEIIDEVLDYYPKVCRCKICRLDIFALALNSLLPHYIVIDSNKVYNKAKMLDSNFQADVFIAISKAVIIVSNKPRHDKEENNIP